jgi:hypothetical protein
MRPTKVNGPDSSVAWALSACPGKSQLGDSPRLTPAPPEWGERAFSADHYFHHASIKPGSTAGRPRNPLVALYFPVGLFGFSGDACYGRVIVDTQL